MCSDSIDRRALFDLKEIRVALSSAYDVWRAQLSQEGEDALPWADLTSDRLFQLFQVQISQKYLAASPSIDEAGLIEAIREFRENLPGWWFSIGLCHISADASCGPTIDCPDADLLVTEDQLFDRGFHCDERDGTMAGSLRDVMMQGMVAREVYRQKQRAAA